MAICGVGEPEDECAGPCISKSWVNDNFEDCEDGSDESESE